MEQRGTYPHTGTAGPPFPVPNTSASTQPALLIPQSPSNETRLRTTSPAPPLRPSKSWPSTPTRTPQPQPQPALSLPSIATGTRNVTNVWKGGTAALDGSPTTPTPYNQVKTTGRQHTERSPNFATNNASPRSTLLPGSASPNQGPPSSKTTPLIKPLPPSAQQGNNGDVVGYSSIDLGSPSYNPWLWLADRGSSTAPLRSMSADSATTAVDEQPEQAFGTAPDQTKSPSTQQIEDMNPPDLENLMKERKPRKLSRKDVILGPSEPVMGGYGMVYSGMLGDRRVAAKMLRATRIIGTAMRPKSDDEEHAEKRYERRLRREINVWAALKHRNICELIGFVDDDPPKYPFMVSPWHERGTAANHLKRDDLTFDDRTRLTKEVCEGLHYLHQLNIIHGDMKPTNVLMDDDGVAKLCDFGLVKLHDWGGTRGMTTTSPFSGTPRYKAPELFFSNENRWPAPTLEGDVYSLGCMMVEFIEGVRPFHQFLSSRDILDAITAFKPPVLRGEIKLALGTKFWILLKMCWHIEKARRPVVGAVVRYLNWF